MFRRPTPQELERKERADAERRERWARNKAEMKELKEQTRAVRQQHRLVKEQARAEKEEAFSRCWPLIKLEYDPESWRALYQEHHGETLEKSIVIYHEMHDCSRDEAEQELLQMLLKVTFLEYNLVLNGPQTSEELFAQMIGVLEIGQDAPFDSVGNLERFLVMLAPLFRKQSGTDNWQNTGQQSRRFCQYVAQRLALGDVIDEDNFDELNEDFKTTIKVEKELEQFAKQEIQLDFSSLLHLAHLVKDFEYDKKLERLFLNPDVRSLALHLPILADTLNSANPKKMDQSRSVSCLMSRYKSLIGNRFLTKVASETLNQVGAIAFCAKFDKCRPEMACTNLSTTGLICPNNHHQQIEIFEVECNTIDHDANLATGEFIVSSDRTIRLKIDFNSAWMALGDRIVSKRDYHEECQKQGEEQIGWQPVDLF